MLPCAAAGEHAPGVELSGNRPEAGRAAGADIREHRGQVSGVPVGVTGDGRLSGAPPLPARLSAVAPFGLPSFTPRLLATLSASLVRLEIASRSCLWIGMEC